MASSRHTKYAVGGVATSSTGIIFVSIANHDWNAALGAAGTVAPAIIVFLIANGGIKGVLRRLWTGLPTRSARRRAVQAADAA